MTAESLQGVFYRLDEQGNAVLFHESGEAVTRLTDVQGTYPVGADLSVQYEHLQGIVLTVADAQRLGIEAE